MPMRALRASKGYATAHVAENLTLWIGISAAAMAVTGLLMYVGGRNSHWGDAMAFFGMALGCLVMIKSQEGFVSAHVAPEDDEPDLPTPATPPPAVV